VFGNLPEYSTPEEVALSRVMQETWAQFAKDPAKGPGWDGGRLGHFRYDGRVLIDSTTRLEQNCEIYDGLYEGRA
jgi:hypothetical protein